MDLGHYFHILYISLCIHGHVSSRNFFSASYEASGFCWYIANDLIENIQTTILSHSLKDSRNSNFDPIKLFANNFEMVFNPYRPRSLLRRSIKGGVLASLHKKMGALPRIDC